jgi:hypothetical protein
LIAAEKKFCARINLAVHNFRSAAILMANLRQIAGLENLPMSRLPKLHAGCDNRCMK